MTKPQGRIRIGIGGWVFEPWRGTFYPDGLPQKRELEHAAAHLGTIEINGTYYGSQKPESFARWRAETRTASSLRLRARATSPIAACWRRLRPRSRSSSPAA